jgi:hypothetical protein
VRLLEQGADLALDGLRDAGGLSEILLARQLRPTELVSERIGGLDDAPVVDRAGRARGDAVHAIVALLRIDHVVGVVMRDGADRASRLAGVAANADLGVDEMLLLEGHAQLPSSRCLSPGSSDPQTPEQAARWIPGIGPRITCVS